MDSKELQKQAGESIAQVKAGKVELFDEEQSILTSTKSFDKDSDEHDKVKTSPEFSEILKETARPKDEEIKKPEPAPEPEPVRWYPTNMRFIGRI
jgi:hypothetical protein